MFEFPFVSLRSHRETLAAKDETIRLLRETIEHQTAALKAFDGLLEALKPKPRVAGAPGRIAEPRAQVNYADIDPTDNEALKEAALREIGPGRHPAHHVLNRIESIRRQITVAREAQMMRAQQPGPPPPPEAIPAAVNKLIEETVAQGEQLATAEAS